MLRFRLSGISHVVARLSQIKVSEVQVNHHLCYHTQVAPPPSNLPQLLELNDSKEAVYGALDAWIAWERNFPIAKLKTILNNLEKDQQWHRVVQLFKGLEAFDRNLGINVSFRKWQMLMGC